MFIGTPLWALRAHAILRPGPRAARQLTLFALLALTAGCATTKETSTVHQFAPAPRVEVGQAELGPVSTRPVAELLREAEHAFEAANTAQQAGNRPEAMRQYKLMLDRLAEAEIDPSAFHTLRAKIDSIKAEGVQPVATAKRIDGLGGDGKFNDIEIPFPLPERVLIEIDEIMKVYPGGFQAGLDRSHRYMPYIRQEFRKAGLPEELAWICMVESQFSPKIDSPAGAGGMWQFMKPTARRYDLRVDSHVDERYNWVSATHSAIEMLSYLHDFFDGDWALAVAAYNMGEGGLSRAREANGGQSDFWTLIETPPASDRIKRETKKYYPRFLASVIVANNPQRYGFKVNPSPAENLVRVPAKAMYALSDLDTAMGVPKGTLAKLNPDLIAEVTPPSGDYGVAVPAHMHDTLAMAFTKTAPTTQYAAVRKEPEVASGGSSSSPGKHSHHRVKRGETVAKIATLYGIDQKSLMAENNLRSARNLRAGQTLRIPGGEATGGRDAATNFNSNDSKGGTEVASKPAATPGETYTVVRGDTLHAIATRTGVSVDTLQEWNSMGGKSDLSVGQKLIVAASTESKNTRSAEKSASTKSDENIGTHKVESGEYPAKIARAYGMSVTEFLALNNLSGDGTIREGQEVKVRGGNGGGSSVQAKAAEPTIHTVASGETASKIAAKYGVKLSDLLAWNGMTSKSVLRVGQQCKINGSGASASKSSEPKDGDMVLASNKGGKAETASKSGKTHVVAKGHNPTSIARQYGVNVSDLFKWNGWSSNHVLKVGDRVKILD